jgi:Cys-tRNA(Pro)/Cys-tRNA(Cys) deacylase
MSRATPALAALEAAGVDHAVHSYDVDDRIDARGQRHAYGAETAAALGIPAERIFKTLVATVDDRLVVAIVPVSGELDLKRLAGAASGRRAAMADPAAAERATGYVVGGISPLGGRRRLPAVLDDTAMGFSRILVSAGRRGMQVELAPADLVQLTGATVAPISRR